MLFINKGFIDTDITTTLICLDRINYFSIL